MTDVEKIAELVAQKIQPSIPVEVDLWSAKELGAYFKVSARSALERYATLPDFPKPIRLPSIEAMRDSKAAGERKKAGKAHPRWEAKEVIAWTRKHKSGSGSAGGRPRET